MVTELVAHPDMVKDLQKAITETNPKITKEALDQEVYQLVLKDNYFNHVMNIVANSFEINVSEDDVQKRMKVLLEKSPDLESNNAKQIITMNIMRELIFKAIIRELQLEVSDDHVKASLDRYYQETGKPIRDFLSDRNRFEEVKRTLTEQLVSERLMNGFKAEFRLEEFNKKMSEQQAQKTKS